jgi:hypothetical protein
MWNGGGAMKMKKRLFESGISVYQKMKALENH